MLAAVLELLGSGPVPAPIHGDARPSTAAAEAAPAPDRPGALAGARVEVNPPPTPARPTPAETGPIDLGDGADCVLFGRCVALEGGAPIPDCTVALSGWPESDRRVAAFAGRLDWRDPAPAGTDATGSFVLRVVPPPPYAFDLLITAPDRVRFTRRWSSLDPRGRIDLGELRLARAQAIRGRVVDEDGSPIAGVTVTCQHPVPVPDPRRLLSGRCAVVSDPTGGFAFAAGFPTGTWPLAVEADGFALVRPAHADVTDKPPVGPVGVVMRRVTEAIRGVVVDTAGEPVRDLPVSAWLDMVKVGQTRTGTDGSFHLFRNHGAKGAPRLRTPGRPQAHGADATETTHDWGSERVRLVLQRAGTLDLEVVEAESGRPVERFSVYGAGSIGGHHPGGRVRIEGLMPGKHALAVYPGSPALAHSAPIEVELGEERRTIRVALEESRRIEVEVVSAAGTPVGGSAVELIEVFSGACTESSGVDQYTHIHEGSFRGALLVGRGTTDARGTLALHAPAAPGGFASLLSWSSGPELTLRIRGEAHPTTLQQVPESIGDVLVRVVVPNGGALLGEVVPKELAGRLPAGIVLRRAEKTTDLPYREIRSDGSFAVRGVPEGLWAVHLAYRLEGWASAVVMRAPLAQVTLREGERRELRLDASALVPCRLRGRLLVAGEPAAHARFFFATGRRTAAGLRFEGTCAGATTDAAGGFTIAAMPPGIYKPRIMRTLPGGTGPECVTSDEWIELTAAEDRVVNWDLPTRRVRLRVLGPGSRPLRHARILAYLAEDLLPRWRDTDQDAWLELPAAPAGTLRLQLLVTAGEYEGFARDELLAGLEGSVVIPTDAREHSVETRLAPPAAPAR
jgi:hypothetical protein